MPWWHRVAELMLLWHGFSWYDAKYDKKGGDNYMLFSSLQYFFFVQQAISAIQMHLLLRFLGWLELNNCVLMLELIAYDSNFPGGGTYPPANSACCCFLCSFFCIKFLKLRKSIRACVNDLHYNDLASMPICIVVGQAASYHAAGPWKCWKVLVGRPTLRHGKSIGRHFEYPLAHR